VLTKLHFKFELFWIYIKKHWITFSIFFVLAISSLIFKKQIISIYNQPAWHVKIIGLQGRYTIDDLPDEISQKVSFGLTTLSENQKPEISQIVENLDIQNESKDYIFNLKNNIYWSSGKKFTAYDVNYQIDGVTITPMSQNSIRISSESEFNPILSLLSQPLIKKNFDGLGNYSVTKITYQEGYIKTIYLKPRHKNDNPIEYRFFFDEEDVVHAFKIGNVDEIRVGRLPQEFSSWKNLEISKKIETDQKYVAVFINTQKITNRQIRQAFAYATPKEDKNERCLGPISPNSWAYNPDIKQYNFNKTRAKELLGDEKIDHINLSINDRELLPIAENIKTSWQDILGIPVSISIENQININDYETLLTYGAITKDPDQYLFWHSTQTSTNITKLNDARIDKLLEEGRQTNDQIERKRIYQNFQTFLLEESPAIFLYYPTVYTITRTK